jgi:threonine dehydrogenase-like Zn-dependent dehydrogenase
MGHEFSGVVVEVGDDVEHLSAGQRVVVRPTIFDRTCSSCIKGIQHCCDNIGFIGLSGKSLISFFPSRGQSLIWVIKGYGGGLAEYITAPAEHFYPIPDNVSLQSAALVEPLAVAWHAVNISPFKPGDNVLVVGGGPIGIGIVQVLKVQGAREIIVVEPTANRRRLSKDFGATHILDPQDVDVPETVLRLTDNIGADVLFDTGGSPERGHTGMSRPWNNSQRCGVAETTCCPRE